MIKGNSAIQKSNQEYLNKTMEINDQESSAETLILNTAGKSCLNPVSEKEDLQYKMATVVALR